MPADEIGISLTDGDVVCWYTPHEEQLLGEDFQTAIIEKKDCIEMFLFRLLPWVEDVAKGLDPRKERLFVCVDENFVIRREPEVMQVIPQRDSPIGCLVNDIVPPNLEEDVYVTCVPGELRNVIVAVPKEAINPLLFYFLGCYENNSSNTLQFSDLLSVLLEVPDVRIRKATEHGPELYCFKGDASGCKAIYDAAVSLVKETRAELDSVSGARGDMTRILKVPVVAINADCTVAEALTLRLEDDYYGGGFYSFDVGDEAYKVMFDVLFPSTGSVENMERCIGFARFDDDNTLLAFPLPEKLDFRGWDTLPTMLASKLELAGYTTSCITAYAVSAYRMVAGLHYSHRHFSGVNLDALLPGNALTKKPKKVAPKPPVAHSRPPQKPLQAVSNFTQMQSFRHGTAKFPYTAATSTTPHHQELRAPAPKLVRQKILQKTTLQSSVRLSKKAKEVIENLKSYKPRHAGDVTKLRSIMEVLKKVSFSPGVRASEALESVAGKGSAELFHYFCSPDTFTTFCKRCHLSNDAIQTYLAAL